MQGNSSRHADPIERVLVIGTDRVAGNAIADRWSERYETIRRASSEAVDCAEVIADAQASLVVYCGPASESSWSLQAARGLNTTAIAEASAWANAAAGKFVAISSDAQFTGPYMFHSEASEGRCLSHEAAVLSGIESAIRDADRRALIVRTHVFDHSLTGDGLVENILDGDRVTIGGGGHATPILGQDLADLLERAVVSNAHGVLHLAGAERVSPHAFVERLREAFDLPRRPMTVVIGEHQSGFAAGDRALICQQARTKFGLSMPLLTDAFARFRESIESPSHSRIAAAA